MDKLPAEVRFKILDHLSHKEKFSLIGVSKHWHDWITSLLYQELQFNRSRKTLSKAIAYFEEYNVKASHVLKIAIKSYSNADSDLLRLPLLFPNVQSFYYQSHQADKRLVGEIDKSWEDLTNLSLLEAAYGEQPLLMDHLLRFPYPYLTTLHLRLSSFYPNSPYPYWGKLGNAKKDSIIENLKNVPTLQELTLEMMQLTMCDLEKLHKAVPQLKIFRLKEVSLRFNDVLHYEDELWLVDDDQTVVKEPAPVYLETLSIRFASTRPSLHHQGIVIPVWLSYIATKYRVSSDLVLNCGYNPRYIPEPLQKEIVKILPGSSNLKHYEMGLCPVTNAIIDKMDESGIHLDSITLYVDAYNTTSQLAALANSNQIQSIKNITFISSDFEYDREQWQRINEATGIQEYYFVSGHYISRYLVNYNNLTHLQIIGSNKSINLTSLSRYLKDLQNLISIALQNIYIQSSNDSLESLGVSHVKNIKLNQIHIFWVSDMPFLNFYLAQLFSSCLHLETFALSTKNSAQIKSMPSLVLNLRSLSKLRSVQLSGTVLYEFVRGNDSRFYRYEKTKFNEINKSEHDGTKCLTKVLLDKKIYINRNKI